MQSRGSRLQTPASWQSKSAPLREYLCQAYKHRARLSTMDLGHCDCSWKRCRHWATHCHSRRPILTSIMFAYRAASTTRATRSVARISLLFRVRLPSLRRAPSCISEAAGAGAAPSTWQQQQQQRQQRRWPEQCWRRLHASTAAGPVQSSHLSCAARPRPFCPPPWLPQRTPIHLCSSAHDWHGARHLAVSLRLLPPSSRPGSRCVPAALIHVAERWLCAVSS